MRLVLTQISAMNNAQKDLEHMLFHAHKVYKRKVIIWDILMKLRKYPLLKDFCEKRLATLFKPPP